MPGAAASRDIYSYVYVLHAAAMLLLLDLPGEQLFFVFSTCKEGVLPSFFIENYKKNNQSVYDRTCSTASSLYCSCQLRDTSGVRV